MSDVSLVGTTVWEDLYVSAALLVTALANSLGLSVGVTRMFTMVKAI